MELIRSLRLDPNIRRPEIVSFVGAGGKSTTLFRLAGELTARGYRVVTATTTRLAIEQIQGEAGHLHLQPAEPLPLTNIARELDRSGHCLLVGSADAPRGDPEKQAGVQAQQLDELMAHAAALGISALLVEADGSRMLPVKAPAAHEPVLPESTTLLVPMMGLDGLGASIRPAHVHRADVMRRLLLLPPEPTPARLTPQHAAELLIHPQGGAKGRPSHARLLPLLNKADEPARLAGGRLVTHILATKGQSALLGTVGSSESPPVLERWGPLAVIVLAAGASTRMGEPKQLLTIDGDLLIRRAVLTALASDAHHVLVVTGAQREGVEAALEPILANHGARLTLHHNPRWPAGQASSIQAGMLGLPPPVEAILVVPVDQPFMPVRLLRRLIQRWQSGADLAAPAMDGSIRGAPALFDRTFWPELAALDGDIGGRTLLERYHNRVAGVPCSAQELRDVDRREDIP